MPAAAEAARQLAWRNSVGRFEFAGKPAGRLRFEWITCNDADLNVIALWAFKQPVFESNGPR
jgi:hypothetical protein